MIFGLNKEEIFCGSVFGAVLFYWIGWFVLLTVPLCAFLWAWTGAGHGAVWRKVGCPLVACGSIYLIGQHWQVWIGFPFMCLVLSLGYGTPCANDTGSPIGRFWYWRVFSENEKRASVATRTTIYALLALSFVPAFLAH